jgi:type IV pilus assembly protein PilX
MHRHQQRGAALVVGMVMLTILTLLAITAMSTSSTELVMAGNEQFRERAFQVAETGVEQAVRDVQTGNAGTDPGNPYKKDNVASTALPDDNYSTVVTYVGEDSDVPGYSANKFVGLHYRIDSNGLSVRNAQSNIRQGTYVLSGPAGSGPSGGAVTYLPGADAP